MKAKNWVISSQIFFILIFFVGMLLNYFTLSPIIDYGENTRIMSEIDTYVDHFYFEDDCDVRDKAQRDSVFAMNLDPFDGDLFIMDDYGSIICAQDGSTGKGVDLVFAKYGPVAAELLKKELAYPKDKSRVVYDKKNHMSLYANCLPSRDLAFFYAVDYRKADSIVVRTFFFLMCVMFFGGLLVIAVGYLVIRRFVTQDHEKKMAQNELETAAAIQKSMLPQNEKHLIQLDVDARLIPARKVGGDFYSFFLSDGILYFCIGDVSGKSVPASIFMTKAVTLFRSFALSKMSPAQLAGSLNDELCVNNGQNMFITGILGTMNTADGSITYVNAGHELPIIWDGKEGSGLKYLESVGNIPLGIMSHTEFVEERHEIEKNGMMLLYTDGVSEAKSGRKGFLGRETLLHLISPFKSLSAKEINGNLLDYINKYEAGIEQSDDITLLTFRNIKRPKQLVLKNEIRELKKIPAFTELIFKECALDRKTRVLVRSGLDEALTNCVLYAYDSPDNEIEVTADIEEGRLFFIIKDSGKAFNPLEYQAEKSDEPKIGGLGISMYKSSFDEVSYQREGGSNILILTKILKYANQVQN